MSLPAHWREFRRLAPFLLLSLSLWAAAAKADSIELVNGDVYTGTLISVSGGNLIFQSEIQGRVVLPREKVARITMRETAPQPEAVSNAPPARPPAAQFSLQFTNRTALLTNTPAKPGEAAIRQLRREGANSKLVTQVREQVLSRAPPEAGDKFDELLSGLLGGQLSIDDLRGQAGDAIKNVKAARGDLGPETALMLDGYLTILQNFLDETAPPPVPKAAAATPSATNAPSVKR